MSGIAGSIRIRLAHATLQRIADGSGIDILHIKGPTVDPSLWRVVSDQDGERAVARTSSDADVLVRPSHVGRFLAGATEHGWIQQTSFEGGSAFGHAMGLYHPKLGSCDVHRYFPGIDIDTEAAFDLLWHDHHTVTLGHVECHVPTVACQRLLLLLHAARTGGHSHPDVEACWNRATPAEREDVLALARAGNAEVPLAAALGTLEDYRHDPRYRLWRHFSSNEDSRLGEWRGRFEAARSIRDKLRVIQGFLKLNKEIVAIQLGHAPSRTELARAHWKRITKLAGDLKNSIHPIRRRNP